MKRITANGHHRVRRLIVTGATRGLILCAVLYLALCLALTFFQRSLLYMPPPSNCCATPSEITLVGDGVALKLAVRPHAGAGAIIYFGGNAEDVSASLPVLNTAFPTRALYLLRYRGYGGSDGQPSEAAFRRDALAVFDYVRRQHGDIVVIGRSLGSGVAIRLASQRPVSKLILVTPYASILALAQQRYPIFPVRWLMQDKFESWREAPQVTAPTLLLAAQYDNLVPAQSTQMLYQHFASGIARLKVIPETDHNNISASVTYPLLLGQFVDESDAESAGKTARAGNFTQPALPPASDATPENPARRHSA